MRLLLPPRCNKKKIKEGTLYYEPFVGYIPDNHRLGKQAKLSVDDLDPNDILLLKDGHCLRDNIINLCNTPEAGNNELFQLKSGSIEILIKLSDEGLGMTLLPYLHTLSINPDKKKNLILFQDPQPGREISLIYSDRLLKMQIIDALYNSISGLIRGAIAFHDVKIVSPLKQ